MRILIVLTYYRPHTSGLTIYAERLAKALVKRGHQVTVLTSRYLNNLPLEEIQDGAQLLRIALAFRGAEFDPGQHGHVFHFLPVDLHRFTPARAVKIAQATFLNQPPDS